MKRQIYVPFHLLENGQIPTKAIIFSKETMLGIQVGEIDSPKCNNIEVVEIPESCELKYRTTVRCGFIQSFDYVNEFVVFDDSTKLCLKSPDGQTTELKPRIKERHVLKYNDRPYEKGNYSFMILHTIDGQETILVDGVFEVV